MTYTYTLYGLTIAAPFACAALPPAPPGAAVDVQVLEGAVPLHLPNPLFQEKNWEAGSGCYLVRCGKKAGRFLVEDGCRITLQRAPDANDERLALHLLDIVIAAVLQQRGHLVLHANTVLTPHGAVAVSGASGAGKTTTFTALMQQGCAVLADDLTVLRLNGQGQVEVLPGVPVMNLLEDSARRLNVDISAYPRHRFRPAKALVPLNNQMARQPAPLSTLYLLETGAVPAVQRQVMKGAARLAAVQACLFGPIIPEEMPLVFPLLAALLEQTPVYRLTRPAGQWSLDAVTALILTPEAA